MAQRVLDQVDEHALELRRRRRAPAGSSAGSDDVDAVAVGAERLERAADELVDRPELRHAAAPRRPPAARGRAGSRPAGRAAAPGQRIDASSSARSLVGELVADRASISLAAPIAVSGERRSWLTDRSTARRLIALGERRSSGVASRGAGARVASALTLDGRDEVDRERDPVLRVARAAKVCRGGRKRKLNVSMLTTETGDGEAESARPPRPAAPRRGRARRG